LKTDKEKEKKTLEEPDIQVLVLLALQSFAKEPGHLFTRTRLHPSKEKALSEISQQVTLCSSVKKTLSASF